MFQGLHIVDCLKVCESEIRFLLPLARFALLALVLGAFGRVWLAFGFVLGFCWFVAWLWFWVRLVVLAFFGLC